MPQHSLREAYEIADNAVKSGKAAAPPAEAGGGSMRAMVRELQERAAAKAKALESQAAQFEKATAEDIMRDAEAFAEAEAVRRKNEAALDGPAPIPSESDLEDEDIPEGSFSDEPITDDFEEYENDDDAEGASVEIQGDGEWDEDMAAFLTPAPVPFGDHGDEPVYGDARTISEEIRSMQRDAALSAAVPPARPVFSQGPAVYGGASGPPEPVFGDYIPPPGGGARLAKPRRGDPGPPVHIHNFPRELFDLVEQQFSKKTSSQEVMLAAFVYAKLNVSCVVSDKVAEQLAYYTGEAVTESTARSVEALRKRASEEMALLRELELAVSWLLCHSVGDAPYYPPNPADPNISWIDTEKIGGITAALRRDSRSRDLREAVSAGRAGR